MWLVSVSNAAFAVLAVDGRLRHALLAVFADLDVEGVAPE
jgi:hypothetical protein